MFTMEAAQFSDRCGGLEAQNKDKCSLVYLGAHTDSPTSLQFQDLPTQARQKQSYEHIELQDDTNCKLSLIYRDHHIEPNPYFRFRDLPTELRWMVWKNLLPEQRFIQAQTFLPLQGHKDDEAMPRDLVIKDLFIAFKQDADNPIRQPILSQICQESRAFFQQHAKMVFSRGAQAPGLWWLPEIDVLEFCGDSPDYRKSFHLQSLQGLEDIKHISIGSIYAQSVGFIVGCHPEACRNGPNEQSEIQMLRLGLPNPVDLIARADLFFYPELFSSLRVLTMYYRLFEDCRKCAIRYHSSSSLLGNFKASQASYLCEGSGFLLGGMSIDDALVNVITLVGHKSWTGPGMFSSNSSYCEGPIIATREGLADTADHLSWFEVEEPRWR